MHVGKEVDINAVYKIAIIIVFYILVKIKPDSFALSCLSFIRNIFFQICWIRFICSRRVGQRAYQSAASAGDLFVQKEAIQSSLLILRKLHIPLSSATAALAACSFAHVLDFVGG